MEAADHQWPLVRRSDPAREQLRLAATELTPPIMRRIAGRARNSRRSLGVDGRPRLQGEGDGWLNEATGDVITDEEAAALESQLLELTEASRMRRGGPPPAAARKPLRPNPNPSSGAA
jgi:hypothetical protein